MPIFHLDYETTSTCDIKLGAYRYAADPSTRILMFAISRDGGTPNVWNCIDGDKGEGFTALYDLRQAIASGSLIYSHNAQFEIAVSHYRMLADLGVKPPKLEQWRCTKAMALRAAIPASLANAAAYLGLTDKDKKGKALIHIFSDQTKLVTLSYGKERMKVASPLLCDPVPWDWTVTVAGEHITVRSAWNLFVEYCRMDVKVENELHQKLKNFEVKGTELDGFLFDMRMNHRGIPVNVPALKNASEIVVTQAERLNGEFQQITGLNPSQTAKVLAWLQAEGYAADNLQAATMEQQVGSSLLTPKGHRALQIRADLSFAAVKKVDSMINTACPDDRMRGLFTWHGAQRTGRWTSSGPQMQNAKKPSIKLPDMAYASVCEGADIDTLEMLHGNPYEVVASVIRNFVQMPDGAMMLDADYSNIESRVASWLVGCDRELDTYRTGRDAYKVLASDIFRVPYEEVNKEQRFVGKVGVLSLVFQTSAQKFHETCAAWGQPVSKEIACLTVKTFRNTYHEYPDTWKAYGEAISCAIRNPGEWFDASPHVKFGRSLKAPFDRLIMRLPSGRDIIYPEPRITRRTVRHKDFETGETREWETDEISFYGQGPTTQWTRITTYPASCFQSSVQGTARDLMMNGCLNAERAGYKVFAVVHDQALAEEGDPDGFIKALCTKPSWLPADFPLEATGGLVRYYAKD